MPTYRVVIGGRNFHLKIDGRIQRCGFFQTVFVEATDPAQAEQSALSIVKASPDLKEVVTNQSADPPMLCLESIAEIASDEAPGLQPKGRSLYADPS